MPNFTLCRVWFLKQFVGISSLKGTTAFLIIFFRILCYYCQNHSHASCLDFYSEGPTSSTNSSRLSSKAEVLSCLLELKVGQGKLPHGSLDSGVIHPRSFSWQLKKASSAFWWPSLPQLCSFSFVCLFCSFVSCFLGLGGASLLASLVGVVSFLCLLLLFACLLYSPFLPIKVVYLLY